MLINSIPFVVMMWILAVCFMQFAWPDTDGTHKVAPLTAGAVLRDGIPLYFLVATLAVVLSITMGVEPGLLPMIVIVASIAGYVAALLGNAWRRRRHG